MRYGKIIIVVHLLLLLSSSALAGMDSAGTSTLGGQVQTDVLTQGGGVQTDGGGLDLSGGDVTDAGQVGATGLTTATIQGSTVEVTGAISNPNSSVRISGNVKITGGTNVQELEMTDLTPSANNDVTPKQYVDSKLADAEAAVPTATSDRLMLYYCTQAILNCRCIVGTPIYPSDGGAFYSSTNRSGTSGSQACDCERQNGGMESGSCNTSVSCVRR